MNTRKSSSSRTDPWGTPLKAFDQVPHKKLLRKLDNYGIRGNIWNWTSAFLNNRQQRVVLDGEVSSQIL
jgi:hypothetical protein